MSEELEAGARKRTVKETGRRRARRGGFTLIELLVVLVIAVAMVAVSAPLLSGVVARAELRETAVELATLLRYARGQAIARRQETSLVCEMGEAGAPRHCAIAALDKRYAIPHALDMRLVTADFGAGEGTAEVRFFPDGTSSGAEITLSEAGRGYAIRVEWLSGQVSLREHRGEDL